MKVERFAIEQQVRSVLDAALGLGGRAQQFDEDTPLLGALPELDSMAVAELIVALEEQIGLVIEDDEVDGSAFATFGALVEFVQRLHASQAPRAVG